VYGDGTLGMSQDVAHRLHKRQGELVGGPTDTLSGAQAILSNLECPSPPAQDGFNDRHLVYHLETDATLRAGEPPCEFQEGGKQHDAGSEFLEVGPCDRTPDDRQEIGAALLQCRFGEGDRRGENLPPRLPMPAGPLERAHPSAQTDGGPLALPSARRSDALEH